MGADQQIEVAYRLARTPEIEIVTEAQSFIDLLAGPLSNKERQKLFRDNQRYSKKYKRCRFCSAWLLRKVKGVDDYDWSPTNDPNRAFCNGGLCRDAFFHQSTGQWVQMMERVDVGVVRPGFAHGSNVVTKSIVRPTLVRVGADITSGGDGDIISADRPEIKPRLVRHLVDVHNRPEAKEPTPIKFERNKVYEARQGKNKGKKR